MNKMSEKSKEGSFKPILFVMFISILIAMFWSKVPFVSQSVAYILNPSAGVLLNWNITWGMMILVFILTVITTIVQKYATDQKELKRIKKEQKELQKELKKYKDHPEKAMEINKRNLELMPKMMKLSMRGIIFTGIPFIIFFRWFIDFFNAAGNPKFFGFMNWIIFYLVFSLIFSSILRKALKIV